MRFEPLEDRRLLALTVTTLVDENDGVGLGGISLREAIAAASPGETIDFSVTGTILLEHGELVIGKDLTIIGPGANRLTIDAAGGSRVFLVDDGNSESRSNVTIAGMTITGGVAEGGLGDGGGILNRESLTIIACHITENAAEDGGGIGNFTGTFVLVDSTVSNNSANGALGGGGGIFNFSENPTDQSIVRNSTISTNDAATTRGGGIYNFRGALRIEFSTVTDNVAVNGEGSGVATLGDVLAATTHLHHSIVAGNVNSDIDVVVGFQLAVTSGGYNVIGFGDATSPFVAPGDQRFVTDASLLLGPLAENYGPTPTHALLAGSPAIDAGDLSAEPGQGIVPDFDQRGAPFARVADGNGDSVARIDVGAFEVPLAIVVDTAADEDDGIGVGLGTSLREAIAAANLISDGVALILFDPELTAEGQVVIELSLGQLEVASSMIIVGPGASLLTVDALGLSRVMSVDDGEFGNSAEVIVRGLTLSGGDVANDGGAIFSRERLTVVDSVVTGSSARRGGGIYNAIDGELTVVRSQIFANHAVEPFPGDAGSGGGLYNAGGYARLMDSTVSGNNSVSDGGGIRNAVTGFLLIERSTIDGNSAVATGGGIRNDGELIVESSTISGNESGFGAGIFSEQHYLLVVKSTISGNSATGSGGGVTNNFGVAYITDSTLHGNSATYGGGLYIAGTTYYTTRVDNSTISGNTATVAGGGVYNFQGTAYLQFTTITANTAPADFGGGFATWADPLTAATYVHGTIIAGNDGSDVFVDNVELNTYYSLGYNLIGTGQGAEAFLALGDQVGVMDPKLGPLADNGGPTWTHALLPGSSAIDAGDPDLASGESVPQYDQRGSGFARIRDGNGDEDGVVDIGAFEVQQFVVPPPLLGDYNRDNTVDAADYTIWRNALGQDVEQPYDGADGDGDGKVDGDDYGVWKAHFGESIEGAGSTAQSLVLAGSGSLGGLILDNAPEATVKTNDGAAAIAERTIIDRSIAEAPPPLPLPSVRNGPSIGATTSKSTTLDGATSRNEALLAWLSDRTGFRAGSGDSVSAFELADDGIEHGEDAASATLDAIFTLLGD